MDNIIEFRERNEGKTVRTNIPLDNILMWEVIHNEKSDIITLNIYFKHSKKMRSFGFFNNDEVISAVQFISSGGVKGESIFDVHSINF